MQTTEKVTPRQLEALEAILAGHRPHYRRDGNRWIPARNMGGAVKRMVDELFGKGLVSGSLSRLDRDVARRFDEYGGKLTAAGLRTIAAAAEARDDEATFQKAAELLPLREAHEAAIAAAIEANEAAYNARARERNLAARANHLANLRTVLARHAIDAARWNDDELLAFARDVEGAEYGETSHPPCELLAGADRT